MIFCPSPPPSLPPLPSLFCIVHSQCQQGRGRDGEKGKEDQCEGTLLYLPTLTYYASHTCSSKIVISHIQTNFSRLTDNSECNCFLMFEKLSEHLQNSSIMLEIVWKPLAVVAGPVLKSSKIFLHLRLSTEVVGSLRRSFEVFGNLWLSSEAVGKSSEIQILWRRKISRILLKKSWQVYAIRSRLDT